jgi:hypothetical protein
MPQRAFRMSRKALCTSQRAEEHPMATIAALLRGVGRCAILLEQALLKLLGNWIRRQGVRLEISASRLPRKN